MYIYIYMCIYIYIYTHIYMCIYIYILVVCVFMYSHFFSRGLLTPASVRVAPQREESPPSCLPVFIWGFYNNFTNYTFTQNKP